MTVQITDAQLTQLQTARSAIRNAISRNRVRMVDIELLVAGRLLDEVLRSQSEQNPMDPEAAISPGSTV